MSARKVTCHHCEGWGCTHCELERRAAAGGEQGLTAVEIELAQTRVERDAWQVRCLRAETALEETREDRDEALAQLALLSKGGAA